MFLAAELGSAALNIDLCNFTSNISFSGSEAYERLCNILDARNLQKDILKLSPRGQTSVIEGYHSLINHFAPKMHHFGFQGMKTR